MILFLFRLLFAGILGVEPAHLAVSWRYDSANADSAWAAELTVEV